MAKQMRVRVQSSWAKDRPALRVIKSTANRMPIKSGIYAFRYFGRYVDRSSLGPNLSKKAHASAEELSESPDLPDKDPNRLYECIRDIAKEYVGMVYDLDSKHRMRYVEKCAKDHIKIPIEKNALAAPALYAESDAPRSGAERTIITHLYRMPFSALYRSANTALQIEKMKRRMAISKNDSKETDNFDENIKEMKKKLKAIDTGIVSPVEDEEFKEEFLSSAAEAAKEMNPNPISFMQTMIGSRSLFESVSNFLRRA